jgi:hypothetical protein
MPADRHDARGYDDSFRCLCARWRVGRKVPRNVYAMVHGVSATDGDVLIGQFDTGALAREAVFCHNDTRPEVLDAH